MGRSVMVKYEFFIFRIEKRPFHFFNILPNHFNIERTKILVKCFICQIIINIEVKRIGDIFWRVGISQKVEFFFYDRN